MEKKKQDFLFLYSSVEEYLYVPITMKEPFICRRKLTQSLSWGLTFLQRKYRYINLFQFNKYLKHNNHM